MSDAPSGSDEEPTDSSSNPHEGSAPRLYRWTCPYCGKVGIQSATPADVDRYVVNSVRSHVRSSEGKGHGPRRQLPDDGDVEAEILERVQLVETDD